MLAKNLNRIKPLHLVELEQSRTAAVGFLTISSVISWICTLGVAERILALRQVAGSDAVLRYAGVLSYLSTCFHLVERLAEWVDQWSSVDERNTQQHFAVCQPPDYVPRHLRRFWRCSRCDSYTVQDTQYMASKAVSDRSSLMPALETPSFPN